MTEFCKHYRAMSEHQSCAAGIPYDRFKGLRFKERPCFEKRGVAPPGCDLAVFPTAEERAEREREMSERFEKIGKARRAIVDHLGGPWKKGAPGATGQLECPVCGGQLAFSRSGYNGHVHARCSTEDCVAWME